MTRPIPTLTGIIAIPCAGNDRACYCAPGQPCHADVLLEVANREVPS